jgi:hypothetical protein
MSMKSGRPGRWWSVVVMLAVTSVAVAVANPGSAAIGTVQESRSVIQTWGVNLPAPNSVIKIWNGHAPYRCLDADTATIAENGTRIQLWDCNGQPQQRWLVFAYPVTGAIGLVSMHAPYRVLDLDVHSAGRNSGRVQLWSYNGESQQQWNRASEPRPADSLRSGFSPHRCLDADVHSMHRLGTIVHMWDCNGQPQQRWHWAYV